MDDEAKGSGGFTISPFSSSSTESQEKNPTPPQPIVLGQMNNLSSTPSHAPTSPVHGTPIQSHVISPAVGQPIQQNSLTGQVSQGGGVFGVPQVADKGAFSWKQFGGGIAFPLILLIIFIFSSGFGKEMIGDGGYTSQTYVIGVGDGETTDFSGSTTPTSNSMGCDGRLEYLKKGEKDWITPQENRWQLNGYIEYSNYQSYNFTPIENGEYKIRSYQDFDGYLLLYNGTFSPTEPLENLTAANDDWKNDYQQELYRNSAIDYVLENNTNYTIIVMGFSSYSKGIFETVITSPSGDISSFNGSTTEDGVGNTAIPRPTGYDWEESGSIWFDCWGDGEITYEAYDQNTGRWEYGTIGWYDKESGTVELMLSEPPENGTEVKVILNQYPSNDEDTGCFISIISCLLLVGGIITAFATGRKWFGIGSLIGLVIAPFLSFAIAIISFSI